MVHHEILPTSSHDETSGSGVWTFYGSARVAAPASTVYSAILDFPSYHLWNQYTPIVDHLPSSSTASDFTPSPLEVTKSYDTKAAGNASLLTAGDDIVIHYRPTTTGSLSLVPCKILKVKPSDYYLCWQGCPRGIPTWIFLPEKVHKVTKLTDQECFLEIYETQGGPMAYAVKWTIGQQLSDMSQGMCEDLKDFVEKKWRDRDLSSS